MIYSARILGNTDGVYIDPCTNETYIGERGIKTMTNYKNVNLDGVKHLVIHRDENEKCKIVQASGYTADRGMFIDMYK